MDAPVATQNESWDYISRETEWLKAGEAILLISDGVTEAPGEEEMFGRGRLDEAICKHVKGLQSTKEMSEGIMGDVLAHAVDGKVDDDTTLVVKIGGKDT